MPVPKGYMGKVLIVDLANRNHRVEPLDPDLARDFLGGRGLGARLLWGLAPAGCDPLGESNPLILMTGPVTGTPVPNASKFVAVTRSPLTGAFLDSYASGALAVELKFAGYDALVITGRASSPCYLWIEDDQVSFRDAGHLWGSDTFDTEDQVRRETHSEAGVISIGPAGENLVRFASINSDYFRQAGRGGAGAVMGAKRLKAVAVRGTSSIPVHDSAGLLRRVKADTETARASKVAATRRHYGTPLTLDITNAAGMLPTRNFTRGVFPEARGTIDGAAVEKVVVASRGCYGCISHCSKVTRTREVTLEGPEYETLGLLGSNLGISDLSFVAEANLRCDALGLDTMSAGVVLGFVMECVAHGLLTDGEVGHKLRFGATDGAIPLLEDIAQRRGFGHVLAEGVRRAADAVGKGSSRFAMHVKGMELPAYDPRAAFGAALTYAVTPRGACHRRAWPPAREVLGNVPPYTTEGKASVVKELYDENTILHCLLVCDFPSKFVPLTMASYADYLALVMGREVSSDDLFTMAERVETLIRLYNLREGFARADDTLPERFFADSTDDGPARGQRIPRDGFERMLSDYYGLRGWNDEGRPTAVTLGRLGLGDLGDGRRAG
jgi:aldehyde:ferredoxin oxidoreductase